MPLSFLIEGVDEWGLAAQLQGVGRTPRSPARRTATSFNSFLGCHEAEFKDSAIVYVSSFLKDRLRPTLRTMAPVTLLISGAIEGRRL